MFIVVAVVAVDCQVVSEPGKTSLVVWVSVVGTFVMTVTLTFLTVRH